MIALPARFKPLAVGALVTLLGASTAGAAMKTDAPALAPMQAAEGRVLQIELTLPAEPVVTPTYPLATFDNAPVNEFKGRAPAGRSWRIGYGPDPYAADMSAAPAGDYRGIVDEDARLDQARFERARDDYERAERVRAERLAALVLDAQPVGEPPE